MGLREDDYLQGFLTLKTWVERISAAMSSVLYFLWFWFCLSLIDAWMQRWKVLHALTYPSTKQIDFLSPVLRPVHWEWEVVVHSQLDFSLAGAGGLLARKRKNWELNCWRWSVSGREQLTCAGPLSSDAANTVMMVHWGTWQCGLHALRN